MEITEILQVLESHRDSLRRTMQIIRELAPTPERMTSFSEFAREARAFEEAAAILRQVPDQGALPPEKLREMGGEPVYIIEEGRGGHWELSENAEDYLEGRDLREYGKKWEAYPCRIAGIPREAWTAEWEEDGECNHKPYRIRDAEKWKKYKCSKCGYKAGRRTGQKFCPSCGKAMNPEAWAELEKRVRG